MVDYRLLDELYFFVRDYSTRLLSLPKVTDEAVKYMKIGGYVAEVTDATHRDYRTISVDGHHFRIVRNKDWLRYEVLPID